MRCSPLATVLLTAVLVSCSSGHSDGDSSTTSSGGVKTVSAAEPEADRGSRRNERPLPAFSGYTLDDEPLAVSSLIGRRFVLFFFNPEVASSKNATLAVNAVAEQSADFNFSVVGVAVGSSREKARRFVAEHGIEFRVIDDSSAQISRRLGLRSPLAMLGIDSEGYLKFGFASLPDDAAAIESQLREALRLPDSDDSADALSSQRPTAPDFIADVLDEDIPFALSAHRGRPVVVMFFLHTCPHCHEALAFFKEALLEIPEDRRPVFAGIEVSGRTGPVRSELRKAGLDFFPVLFDHDAKIREAYGVRGGVPDTFLLDTEGRIAARVRGWRETDPPLMRMRMAKLSGSSVPMLLRKTGYSGNEVCGVCHEAQLDTWQFTRHASAFGTLVKHGEDSKGECVSCHVVGWDEPGGFDLARPDPALENVGCEACHGRGGPHLSPDFVDGGSYEPVCATCHDAKHSLGFDYATFHPRISHSANLHLALLPAKERKAKLAALGRPGGDVLATNVEYVGSEACATCHASEYATWLASPHAAAHASLGSESAKRNAECLQCHTTGMGRPGGFPASGDFVVHATANADLARVGCESCHGPGGDHIAPEALKIGSILSLGDKCDSCAIQLICGGCHDDANDPGFEFEVQDKIERQHHGTIEPGSGKPLGSSANTTRPLAFRFDRAPQAAAASELAGIGPRERQLLQRGFAALDGRS